MLAPVHHITKKALVHTAKDTLRRLWLRVNRSENTRPEYLEHLKV